MRPMIKLIGYIGIVAAILPSILFLAGRMELGTAKIIMLLATIVWFAAATIVEWNLDKKYFCKTDK
ncbi:MAG: hypothetical protein JW787_01130 [Sedimentisphaerales bacterium]|nr:hypothetical protein [Sedimentisphaerales bacterium]